VTEIKKTIVIMVILSVIFGVTFYEMYDLYENCYHDYIDLIDKYNALVADYNELGTRSEKFREEVMDSVHENNTAVTIIYYTNFSRNQHILTLSVPYQKYNASHYSRHPTWNNLTLESVIEYITYNESIIENIVETVKTQTHSKEELANALLDFVQDKHHGLSVRYYPTSELKHPIETLVEMGGDCDTHTFLYGSLMKGAGFKVLILLSKEEIEGQPHAAVAVHLENPPENSRPDIKDKNFTYNGNVYYYAETTMWNFRVGDIPPVFDNLTFHLIPA
jgi:hypothetical protein